MKTINRNTIKSIVETVLKESVFGLNGNDLTSMGLKNPADDYPVDYNVVLSKAQAFKASLDEFIQFIDGVEEDVENNTPETSGVVSNMRMRALWNNDEDEEEYAKELTEVSRKLSSVSYTIGDLIEYCEYKIQK